MGRIGVKNHENSVLNINVNNGVVWGATDNIPK